MNKIKIIVAVLCCSFVIQAAESNCDSLRIQGNLLKNNVKRDLFTAAGAGLFCGAIFITTYSTGMKINNNVAATWGFAIGMPVGVLVVTIVDVARKIKFNIENKYKCKYNETQLNRNNLRNLHEKK